MMVEMYYLASGFCLAGVMKCRLLEVIMDNEEVPKNGKKALKPLHLVFQKGRDTTRPSTITRDCTKVYQKKLM